MSMQDPGTSPRPTGKVYDFTQLAIEQAIRVQYGDVVNVFLDGSFGYERNDVGYNSGRPAVVVQNKFGNAKSPTTIVMLIGDASKNNHRYHEDVFIPAKHMGANGKDSVASAGNIRTIDLRRINLEIGIRSHLPAEIMAQVRSAIAASFALGEYAWRA